MSATQKPTTAELDAATIAELLQRAEHGPHAAWYALGRTLDALNEQVSALEAEWHRTAPASVQAFWAEGDARAAEVDAADAAEQLATPPAVPSSQPTPRQAMAVLLSAAERMAWAATVTDQERRDAGTVRPSPCDDWRWDAGMLLSQHLDSDPSQRAAGYTLYLEAIARYAATDPDTAAAAIRALASMIGDYLA